MAGERTNHQITVNAIAHLKCTFTTCEILQRHLESARISPVFSDFCHSPCFSDSSAKRHSGLQDGFALLYLDLSDVDCYPVKAIAKHRPHTGFTVNLKRGDKIWVSVTSAFMPKSHIKQVQMKS